MNFDLFDIGRQGRGPDRQPGRPGRPDGMPDRSERRPDAYAMITGSTEYPGIRGIALFYNVDGGTWIEVQVTGLPEYRPGTPRNEPVGPFGFHIHDGGTCSPVQPPRPFERTMGHYNPTGQPHGNHAGDLPVLFSNNGYSRMSFFTGNFTPRDVLNRSLVIHLNPDDYRTEPAGNSGKRIACGVIARFGRPS